MPKQNTINSIRSLHSALLEAVSTDNDEYIWLSDKCNNQSNLASVKNESLGISPISINTLKDYSAKYIDGGFETIDKLRKKIYNKTKPKQKRTKDSSKSIISELKVQLEKATRTRAIMIKAYNDLNRITLDSLASNQAYQRDYDNHVELYKGYFGMQIISNDE